ncbi:hypothetical protein JRO89_XS15G0178100 [Xanthoceras sorbifolium]|uniref:UDP-sugar pyrophosphorylase n=1 Tax=Xanthoceras sorbifolium TaxID=99658 RepID=A0ABQ8H2R7_9ROSI|nr:hypothetical protein JRO89_XS15G0178100 [Xanthoceras sorbifolium]
MAATIESATDHLSKLGIDSGFANSAPNLRKNLHLLSSEQIELAKMLIEMGQSHLFEHWPEPGIDDEEKRALLDQVARLNSSYPGGLKSYIKTARELLAESKAGQNPFDGFTPSVPTGEALSFGDDIFINYEQAGIREAKNAAFVLVAGGLGERLGYNGIKVALPAETTTGTCFLQQYIESILVLQDASCSLAQGDYASQKTVYRNGTKLCNYTITTYGLHLEKVACLDDNDARLALDPKNKYIIQTKPHGHGDVHSLLYSSGLLNIWHDAGLKWVLFFQDTNGLLFKAIPASLGVSATKQYHVNSLAVPRKSKDAIGGITRLTHTDGRSMVINVEYNQLDPLLRATGFSDGDVNCETGYSPFPGNINQVRSAAFRGTVTTWLYYCLQEHLWALDNLRYKDASKTSFKSSTRLECMMQDYPKTLPPTARVGFTDLAFYVPSTKNSFSHGPVIVIDAWLAYAPVKNNPEDAAKMKVKELGTYFPRKVPKGNPYHSATSGEMAIYRANSLILKKAGVQVDDPVQQVFNGQEVEVWPRIVWKPTWGITFSEIKSKIRGSCSISQKSTMVIKGRNVFLQDLSLDGALIVDSVDGAEEFSDYCLVKVGGSVKNKGWMLENVDYKDTTMPEEIRTRGFKINKIEQLEKKYSEPGKFCLEP